MSEPVFIPQKELIEETPTPLAADAPNNIVSQQQYSPEIIALFSKYDLWFAQILIIVLLACLAGYIIFRISFPNPELTVLREPGRPYAYTIDINEADWIHWMLLPGVGEKLARKIVAYREEHGPFKSIEDVIQIKGIGQITFEKLRPHLKCKATTSTDTPNPINSSPQR